MASVDALPAIPRPSPFETRLSFYRDLIVGPLMAILPAREPRRYLYDLVSDQIANAGKGLRPALCLATCQVFGGSAKRALQSALTLELLHNAFLVHDDVEDESEYRRDRPTVVAEHGVGIAVNVGDALNALSMRPLSANIDLLGPVLATRVYQEFEHMLVQSIEGQAIELGWIRDNRCDLDDDDYLRMSLKKTGWYTTIHPCRIGALIGTNGQIDPSRFNRFGHFLGAAFQIQDDLLNLVGDRGKYGKEILGDLWEGKRTLMLVHALRYCRDDERRRVKTLLGTPRGAKTERDVRWLLGLLEQYGSLDYARESARALAAAAEQEMAVAYAGAQESDDLGFIRGLVQYVVQREV
jgi:geranylgeranyl diphosphate synthase, type II